MPAYEYRCQQCQTMFEVVMSYEEYDQKNIHCPACDSEQIRRIIRPVRITRSEEDRFQQYADPALLNAIDEDPRALGKMMRDISDEMGEDMGPEFDEVVDRLEKGQSPEEIENDLPDLGMGDEDFTKADDF